MEIQANPSADHLQLILFFLIPVILVATGIIGFFLKKVSDSFSDMAKAIKDMREAFALLNSEFSALRTKVEIESPSTLTRLNSHSLAIDNHEIRILKVETEHEIFHKNCPKTNRHENYRKTVRVRPDNTKKGAEGLPENN